MSELSLPAKVLALSSGLRTARIAHAFGGALALAYYAEPRATIDIDINVFLTPPKFDAIVPVLAELGVDVNTDRTALERDGQCRLRWGRTPLDVFMAYDELHNAMNDARRQVPFADGSIPILSPEHLTVCKAIFSRPKDWLDIEQMTVGADTFDRREVERWLVRIVGDEDKRTERFRALADLNLG